MAIACIVITSCYDTYLHSTEEWKNSHIGATHNQIVSSYGAPTRQQPDGNGGTILVYEINQTSSQSVATASNFDKYTGTYVPGVHTESLTYSHYNQFFIDSKGYCYQVKTNINHDTYTHVYNKKRTRKTLWICGGIWAGCVATAAIVAGVMNAGD